MREAYNTQLKRLHEEMIQMGSYCEEAIALAISALVKNKEDMIERVFEVDSKIDNAEREIESLCMKLLLKQQPIASDLREISAALKMISDMERIGDQASDIAEITKFIIGQTNNSENNIKLMAQDAVKMVTESINSFVEKNLEKARAVIAYDDIVDDWFDKIKKELIRKISDNSAEGEYYIDLLMVAKYLERIGDHATNIAEWVEYSITGEHKGAKPI